MLLKRILCFLFLSGGILNLSSYAQNSGSRKFRLSGQIRSDKGEILPGVTIQVAGSEQGTSSDADGNFTLTLPAGSAVLHIASIGFEPLDKSLTLLSNMRLDIKLKESGVETGEVLVKATREKNNVKGMEMGVQKMDMQTLRKLPSFLGEVDVIRAVLSLPGVSTVGEGATGFNVRGGGVDQNLVLMDGEPVFNSSHLFGFFSIYNPDAVMDATLIKGGIPAMYGGRLSSILDVNLKDGDFQQISGSGGIGSVSSRISVGGPIEKNKSSFFLAARRSYADLFLKLSSNPMFRSTYAYFYDLNAKASFDLGPSDKLDFTSYYGRDVANLDNAFAFSYGNALAGLHWNHKFNSKLQADVYTGLSDYTNMLGIPSGVTGFNYQTAILNSQAKADFKWAADSSNQIRFGASINRFDISPGKVKPIGDSTFFNTISVSSQRAYEYGLYLQNEESITKKFSAQYGLRLSVFDYVATGTDSIFSYQGPNDMTKQPVDGRVFTKGSSISRYFNLEPRLSLRYLLSDETSLKASYNRTTQYIHLISNTNAASPFDIWATTSNNIKPERADQVSLGYFRNFNKSEYESSVEVYYKKLDNQIDYVNGAQTLLNKNLEGELLYGIGRSYGAEFYIKKNSGKLNGWISYTLSKSERKIDGIDNDNWYRSKYDRTHSLTAVAIYDLNSRWNFSANFTLQSGVVTTFPNSRYSFEGIVVPYNTDNSRNNYRLPSYNRLDLAATLYNRRKPGRKFHSNWVFSLYNVYSRRNAYTIYFQANKDNPNITEAQRLSILGSIIPGVTWNFDF